MSAGRLRERITVQYKASVRTDTGGYEETWADLTTVWGRSWGATGQERQFAAMAGQVQVSRHFCIRHYAALNEGHRIVFNGQSYNVVFVNHAPHEGWTYFDAKALTGREAS